VGMLHDCRIEVKWSHAHTCAHFAVRRASTRTLYATAAPTVQHSAIHCNEMAAHGDTRDRNTAAHVHTHHVKRVVW